MTEELNNPKPKSFTDHYQGDEIARKKLIFLEPNKRLKMWSIEQ